MSSSEPEDPAEAAKEGNQAKQLLFCYGERKRMGIVERGDKASVTERAKLVSITRHALAFS